MLKGKSLSWGRLALRENNVPSSRNNEKGSSRKGGARHRYVYGGNEILAGKSVVSTVKVDPSWLNAYYDRNQVRSCWRKTREEYDGTKQGRSDNGGEKERINFSIQGQLKAPGR